MHIVGESFGNLKKSGVASSWIDGEVAGDSAGASMMAIKEMVSVGSFLQRCLQPFCSGLKAVDLNVLHPDQQHWPCLRAVRNANSQAPPQTFCIKTLNWVQLCVLISLPGDFYPCWNLKTIGVKYFQFEIGNLPVWLAPQWASQKASCLPDLLAHPLVRGPLSWFSKPQRSPLLWNNGKEVRTCLWMNRWDFIYRQRSAWEGCTSQCLPKSRYHSLWIKKTWK